MEVRIIFKDATAEKCLRTPIMYIQKGGLLVVREGDWLFKYPLTEIFSVVHKHGNHWGSNSHRTEEGLE